MESFREASRISITGSGSSGLPRSLRRRQRCTDAEPACGAAAQHALGVLDLAAGRGLHEGDVEAADVGVRLRQRVEHAVPGLDFAAFAAVQRLRFVTERVEL